MNIEMGQVPALAGFTRTLCLAFLAHFNTLKIKGVEDSSNLPHQ